MEKLDAATTLIDLLLGAYGIFSQILDVVVAFDTVDIETIAHYVFNAPEEAQLLADNCMRFHAAAAQATGQGGDPAIGTAFEALLQDAIGDGGTEWLLASLEHYLAMVQAEYNGIDVLAMMAGESHFEAQIRRRMERLRTDADS